MRIGAGLLLALYVLPCAGAHRSEESGNKGAEITQQIPFDLSAGFLVVVTGKLGELSNQRFILDTGTRRTVIDAKIADELHLKQQPDRALYFNKPITLTTAVIPTIEFGPRKETALRVEVADLSRISALTNGIAAVVGLDLLAQSNFTIDYDHRLISFIPADRHSVTTVDFIRVEMQLLNRPVHLIVDTGLRDAVLYEDRIRIRVPELMSVAASEPVHFGAALTGREVFLQGVRVGGKKLSLDAFMERGSVAAVPSGIDGCVGVKALKARRIEFDFETHSVRWQ